jgi:hypothetical protein
MTTPLREEMSSERAEEMPSLNCEAIRLGWWWCVRTLTHQFRICLELIILHTDDSVFKVGNLLLEVLVDTVVTIFSVPTSG